MGDLLAGLGIDAPVALAPLAGITDRPFRDLVGSFGAGWVVSEMVASQDIVNAKPDARAKAELGFDRARTFVQIAGREIDLMVRAARIAEDAGAAVIDINMGCPAKKVTSGSGAGACGAALLREPDLALRLIEAVVGAVGVPVTLKTRLGWDDSQRQAPALARAAQEIGVAMVTIHGRTRAQFYKGRADWDAIAEVSAAVDIPVIANGDITGPETAREALAASGADGVMIGRGAQGRPWVIAQTAAGLYGAPEVAVPEGREFCDMVSTHYEAMLTFYGAQLGARVARKHLGWYMDVASSPKPLRQAILTEADPARVLRLLPEALIQPDGRAAA